jgi:hypothetical protein
VGCYEAVYGFGEFMGQIELNNSKVRFGENGFPANTGSSRTAALPLETGTVC